jgi:hypothetical protein
MPFMTVTIMGHVSEVVEKSICILILTHINAVSNLNTLMLLVMEEAWLEIQNFLPKKWKLIR